MKFEEQEYQIDCVSNIIDIVKEFDFKNPNLETLKQSLQSFYRDKGKNIPMKDISNRMNLDILMETGTGKTFTYVKTMFELNKTYGINKFIIFVPRAAIKAGVKQNIKLTKEYFKIEYKKELKVFEYSTSRSTRGSSIVSGITREFISDNNDISVLLLTNSAIDKGQDNLLNKPQEYPLWTGKQNTTIPLVALKDIDPVIIMDEPHLLKGDKFTRVFDGFKNICLRFGATFPKEKNHELSNVAYVLDSISAFKQYLVKKIRVSTLINNNNVLKIIDLQKKSFTVLYYLNNEEYKCEIKLGEDIGGKTKLKEFISIKATSISKQKVYLSNESFLEEGNYVLDKQEQERLIKTTIEKHFAKEEILFRKGVKTLSLFFINNIDDFKGENPIVKQIFEKHYSEIRKTILDNPNISKQYKEYLKNDYKDSGELQVHEGYFSNSKGSKDEQEAQAIDIILNKKEELLSLSNPLRFVFSVWALQEGWDNPNIFNICKLSSTKSDTSRRQQVGRGLRIAVNQSGIRLTRRYLNYNDTEFYDINTLDVLVSGQELEFIESLQTEINNSSYIISSNKFKFDDIKLKTNLENEDVLQVINTLTIKDIILYDKDTKEYIIKSSVYDFINNNKQEFDFLSETNIAELLAMFTQSANRDSQIENANKPKSVVTVNKDLYQEFKQLWDLINTKAKIVFNNSSKEQINDLIQNIKKSFYAITINKVNIKVKTQELDIHQNIIVNKEEKIIDSMTLLENNSFYQDFMFDIVKKTEYPLFFIKDVINNILQDEKGKSNILNNPKQAKEELLKSIIENSYEYLLQCVSYDFESEVSLNNNSILEKETIPYTSLGQYIDEKSKPLENYLYDKVVYDSDIEKQAILKDPRNVDGKEITVFAKLPKISIPTPFKTYNPDFAYVMKCENDTKLFLVAETKGYKLEADIPEQEKQKIDYAKKFFEKLQKIQKQEDSNIKIAYKTRINKQSLVDIVKDI